MLTTPTSSLQPRYQPRYRAPEYTTGEIRAIIDFYKTHKSVLYSRAATAAVLAQKRRLYDDLVAAVNRVDNGNGVRRSLQSIKDKWQNIQRNVKAKVATLSRQAGVGVGEGGRFAVDPGPGGARPGPGPGDGPAPGADGGLLPPGFGPEDYGHLSEHELEVYFCMVQEESSEDFVELEDTSSSPAEQNEFSATDRMIKFETSDESQFEVAGPVSKLARQDAPPLGPPHILIDADLEPDRTPPMARHDAAVSSNHSSCLSPVATGNPAFLLSTTANQNNHSPGPIGSECKDGGGSRQLPATCTTMLQTVQRPQLPPRLMHQSPDPSASRPSNLNKSNQYLRYRLEELRRHHQEMERLRMAEFEEMRRHHRAKEHELTLRINDGLHGDFV